MAITASLLGESWARAGNYAAAESLLVSSHAVATSPAVDEAVRKQSFERLVKLYEAWGKPAEEARYRKDRAGWEPH